MMITGTATEVLRDSGQPRRRPVRGFGQQYGHRGTVRPADQQALILPKLRIDAVVYDEVAGQVTDAIAKSVNMGTVGDGKIWICDVESVLRVRTGERDRDAV